MSTAEVVNLVPEGGSGVGLTANTVVRCINRGRAPLKDKFDGRDYVIPPGYFTVRYGAARHFQTRLVVPGTRNPEIGTEQSFIGIVQNEETGERVDDDFLCVPLTDEECERAGQAVEAIDRAALSDPADRDVRAVKAGAGQPNRRGKTGLRPELDSSVQVSEAAREAAEHIFDKPETSATREDAEAAASEAEGGSRRRGR